MRPIRQSVPHRWFDFEWGWLLMTKVLAGIIIAPVILGAGKRLFEGFSGSLELEHLGVRQSSLATFIDYRVPAGAG